MNIKKFDMLVGKYVFIGGGLITALGGLVVFFIEWNPITLILIPLSVLPIGLGYEKIEGFYEEGDEKK